MEQTTTHRKTVRVFISHPPRCCKKFFWGRTTLPKTHGSCIARHAMRQAKSNGSRISHPTTQAYLSPKYHTSGGLSSNLGPSGWPAHDLAGGSWETAGSAGLGRYPAPLPREV